MHCDISFRIPGDRREALKVQAELARMGATDITIRTGEGRSASWHMNPSELCANSKKSKREAASELARLFQPGSAVRFEPGAPSYRHRGTLSLQGVKCPPLRLHGIREVA